jgi:DNA-binding phage protein
MNMPTRPTGKTFLERAKRDPKFRAALIGESVELIAEGDVETAKSIIHDYVLASIGFEALAKRVGKTPESIKRMLSQRGNPTIKNMASLLASISKHEGVTLHVQVTR